MLEQASTDRTATRSSRSLHQRMACTVEEQHGQSDSGTQFGWIDDWMPIGSTKQRCQNRQDILIDVLKVAGLPLSPKCKFKVSEMGRLIGMHWTEGGHCCSRGHARGHHHTDGPVPQGAGLRPKPMAGVRTGGIRHVLLYTKVGKVCVASLPTDVSKSIEAMFSSAGRKK